MYKSLRRSSEELIELSIVILKQTKYSLRLGHTKKPLDLHLNNADQLSVILLLLIDKSPLTPLW